VATLAQIPDVQGMAVLSTKQQVWHRTVFDHFRRSPLTGNRDVVPEVPPEIIGEVLRSTIDFPSPQHVKAFMVEQEDSAGSIARGVAERADVDRVRPTVDGVRATVAGPLEYLLRLDHAHNTRIARVGFRIENVNPRRADTWDDQIAPLDVRMGRVRAEGSAARVPSEVMKFVAHGGDFGLTYHLRVSPGRGVKVDHT
jgi:hypothetical protein